MKKLVIVGSGMSAMKVVDEVLKIDPHSFGFSINSGYFKTRLKNKIILCEISLIMCSDFIKTFLLARVCWDLRRPMG
jgi:hypothetical protein